MIITANPEHARRIRPASRPAKRIADPRHSRRHALVRRSGGRSQRARRDASRGAIRARARELEQLVRAARRAAAEARLAESLGAGRVDGRLGRRLPAAARGAVRRRRGPRPRPVGQRRPHDDSARRRHLGRPARFLSPLLRIHSGRGARHAERRPCSKRTSWKKAATTSSC